MPRPNADSKPHLAPGCRLSEMPNQEATLMMPEGALKLMGPGLQILRSCDGNHTFQQIVDALYKQYQRANLQKIEEDTATFLEQLQERRAVDF